MLLYMSNITCNNYNQYIIITTEIILIYIIARYNTCKSLELMVIGS